MDERIDEIQALRSEIAEVRRDMSLLKGQYRRHLTVAVGLIALLGLVPTWGFARAKKTFVLKDAATGDAVELSPSGLHFTRNGVSKFWLQVGADWGDMTMWGPNGNATWNLHSDQDGTATKIFSKDQRLRIEVSDNLLDSGAGVRLYDDKGLPRATYYAGKWGGKSGLQFTNAKRQPRLDLYAVEKSEAVVRVIDERAIVSAEMGILPHGEAMYRYTGMVPDTNQSNHPLVPLVYLTDHRQDHLLLSTIKDD